MISLNRSVLLKFVANFSKPKNFHYYRKINLYKTFSCNLSTANDATNTRNEEKVNINEADLIIKNSKDIINFQDAHLAKYILDSISTFRDTEAMVNGETGKRMTYEEVESRILKCANILLKLGVKKGDAVTLFSPNNLDYSSVVLGIMLIGAICSPVNNLYTADELLRTAKLSKPHVIITVSSLLQSVNSILPQCPSVKNVLLIGEETGNFLDQNKGENYTTVPDISIDMDDVASLPFSSGTTGLPKAVQLTHRNIVYNCQQYLDNERVDYIKSDIVLSVLPFFHIYGFLVSLSGLYKGITQIVMSKFDPQVYLKCLHEYQCSYLFVVPPILLFLTKHPMVSKITFPYTRRIISGAAPATGNVINDMRAKVNKDAVIKQGYGLTETAPIVSVNLSSFHKDASVGPAIPHTEIKILDENGLCLPRMKNGEICVRGPQVMKGYFQNPEANKNAFTQDGFLRTGDIGYVDEDDFLYIVDRSKELIKVKGFQVAPVELESILLTHELIADAAVIGIPDEKLGESPRAFVVLKNGAVVDGNSLIKFVDEQVAPFKQLKGGVEFVSEIPKSPSGKILRKVLKDNFLKLEP